jgi:hypothetical protein
LPIYEEVKEMTVENALKQFMERHEETIKALQELKNTVKSEGSKVIQEYVMKEDFESVTHVVSELNNFTKLEYNSNVEEVIEFVGTVFGEIKPEQKKVTASFFPQTKELSDELEETLKTIGYNGIARIKDAKQKIKESSIYKLEELGYLMTEEVRWGKTKLLTFELNSKGRKKFQELFHMEPNESFRRELMKKYPSIEKGYFLFDAENALQTKEFNVHEINEQRIEISKDNYHYYLTPDLGNFDEEDYFQILDEQNSLKSIGFVCVDEDTLVRKARKAVDRWVENNRSKCKFLAIHMTTIDEIENSQKVFDTMSF